MPRLDDLAMFQKLAALRSFTAVANESGLDPSAPTAALGRLEAELGVALFIRTPRLLSLSEAGGQFLPFASAILEKVRCSTHELTEKDTTLDTIRLIVPADLCHGELISWLIGFQAAHPAVSLEISVACHGLAHRGGLVDIAIGYREESEDRVIAMPLHVGTRKVLVASGGYLSRRGTPRSVADLASHACLALASSRGACDRWHFPGNDPAVVPIRVHRSCNDAALLRRWSIDGDGVAYLPWPDVAADVRAGRLHTMLLSTRGEPISLDLLVAHRDQLSEQVRHLHAWLMQCLEGYEMRYPPPW